MDGEIRILILEDNPIDAELADYTLKAAGLNFISKVVETEGEYRSALNEFSPDLILSDYDLPTFNGADALSIVKEIRPDLPFILYTGALGEERAIEILTGGATDYVMKNRLSRLVPAVERALKEAEEHRKRRTAEVERDLLLQQLEARVQERTAQLQDEITDRKRAEAEKARLATFPTLNPNPITEFDDAGQVYYLNPSAEQLFPELRSRGLEHPWLRDWKIIVDDLRKSGDKGSVREVNVGESGYQKTIHDVNDPRRNRLYDIDITKRKRSE